MTEHIAPRLTTIVRTGIPLRPRRHLPKTFEERAELGARELRVPATFEEYLRMSLECDYRLHVEDREISLRRIYERIL